MIAADPRRSGTIFALAFAGLVSSHSESGAANWLTTCWLPAEGRLSSDAPAQVLTASSLSNQEMVAVMRDNGFPITAIAEMMGVERKTIYAWLDGAALRDENAIRLASLYQTLMDETNGDFRPVYRVWNQIGPKGQTLRGVLSSKELDLALVSQTLASLRNAMAHYARIEGRGADSFKMKRGGNPGLDELPVADSG